MVMKKMKRFLALALAMIMVMAMVMPAMAAVDAGTYTIKITNSNDSVSINGQTFSAYKLFDVTYQNPTDNPNTVYGEDTAPHAYTLSTSSSFYTTAAAKAIIEQYFTLTEIEGDDTKVLVAPKLVADGNGKEPGTEGYVETTHFTAVEAYELAEKLKPYLTTANATATASDEVATIDVSNKGDAGYYLVTGSGKAYAEGDTTTATGDTVTAAVALTTTDPKAEIIAKLEGVSVEKEIDEGENAGVLEDDDVKEDNHAVGDTVPYIIKSKVPNMTGYEKYFFIVNDTLSKGLTYNADSLVIKFVDEGGEVKKTLTKGTDYTVTTTGGSGADTAIEIVFTNFIQYKGTLVTKENFEELDLTQDYVGTYVGTYEDCDIIITYNATVNEYAVIGDLGNPNTATIEYSTNPDIKDNGSPDNPDKPSNPNVTGETPDSTTNTYVTGLKLLKFTGADKTPLKDAKFELTGTNLNKLVEKNTDYFRAATDDETATHYLLKDGTYTTVAPVMEDDETTTDINEKTVDSYVITWEGVTPAPGYIKDTIQSFAMEGTKPNVKYTVQTDAEGIITLTGLAAGNYVLKETEAPAGYNKLDKEIYITVSCGNTEADDNVDTHTWTITYKMGENGTEQTLTSTEANANLFELDIENKAGTELPSTGGVGTTMFYVVGAILVIGAGVLLVSRKRMNLR
jgi:fimbrial isopeptide formation D2 family protein/LPXTG-motif cell wall-anchored protein